MQAALLPDRGVVKVTATTPEPPQRARHNDIGKVTPENPRFRRAADAAGQDHR